MDDLTVNDCMRLSEYFMYQRMFGEAGKWYDKAIEIILTN